MRHLEFRYPRRRLIRALLQKVTFVTFSVLSDYRVIGRDNLPNHGPLLVVGNHFSFLDPVAVISVMPWPIEFVGGFTVPNAPSAVAWLRKLWGFYPVYRGTGSQIAFRAAQGVLGNGGVMGIFPEGTSAHAMLRPPRLGAALMAVRSSTLLLPVGLAGLTGVIPALRQGRRARVTVRIGQPFGPFVASGRGRRRREQLEEISAEIMRRIAELLPPDQRGFYSDDPQLREAAREAADFPWGADPEG